MWRECAADVSIDCVNGLCVENLMEETLCYCDADWTGLACDETAGEYSVFFIAEVPEGTDPADYALELAKLIAAEQGLDPDLFTVTLVEILEDGTHIYNVVLAEGTGSVELSDLEEAVARSGGVAISYSEEEVAVETSAASVTVGATVAAAVFAGALLN
jgi:hypothetical protein